MTPLVEAFLPQYDAASRHCAAVAAPPERVWAAVRALDLGGSPLVRALFLLRGLPALLARPRATLAARRAGERGLGLTLDELVRGGFTLLGERPGEELLLGLVGRFWRADGGIVRVAAEEWRAWERPGYAKAAWSFSLRPGAGGAVHLATETRVRCTDEASRRRFLRYWRVVGPFSGLVRREMLRAVAKAATR
ncbi:MAG TPA: hypothetical protein VHG51_07025 [Longimicrobiaceae bacterium]|nr:hypothetical protein [Longimicrobiaceae bacterium]